jgi:BRCT domain type II-containing protein
MSMTYEAATGMTIHSGRGVPRTTAFLVIGDGPGSTKTGNARKYGAKSLNEADFIRLIASS